MSAADWMFWLFIVPLGGLIWAACIGLIVFIMISLISNFSAS